MEENANRVEGNGTSEGANNGAQRAARYSSNWPTVDLNDALSNFTSDNPVITVTEKGKRIFANPDAGIQVVQDLNGNYCRIFYPSIRGERACLDMNGNIPVNKILSNGRKTGRSQSEYNQITHFNIE